MGFAALYSGGKDSSLALWLAQRERIDVDVLITVVPEKEDSYMFHKPNLHLVPQLADSMDIDLIKVKTEGKKEKELNDLRKALEELGDEIDGLIVGAVASSYQMDRVERLGSEFSLEIYAPLWNMDQKELLDELVENGFKAIMVSVSAMGLDQGWLGRQMDQDCIDELLELEVEYGINPSGEGGEYETLVLDAPNYQEAFKVLREEKEWDGRRGVYRVKELVPDDD